MMWAVDVPALMIQAPLSRRCSGRPSEACVAPGTAIRHFVRGDVIAIGAGQVIPDGAELRFRARAVLFHLFEHRLGLRAVAGRFRFQVLRFPRQVAMLVHCTANGCCCGIPERS